MQKVKTKENIKFYLFFILSLFIFISPIFFTSCNASLTDGEKIKNVIEQTSLALSEVDDYIMSSEDSSSSGLQKQLSQFSALSETPTYSPHTQIDRGSNQHVYKPASQLTISFGYYALTEYFLECIPNFFNKTLKVEQTYYSDQQIWVNCSITDDIMNLHIWTEYRNDFEEYINITVYYNNKNFKPTKFIHRETRHCSYPRNYFGYIEVDFKSSNCIVETITYNTNEEIDYSSASDEIIKNNVARYVKEEFNFKTYKSRTTKSTNQVGTQISEQELIGHIRDFNHAYTRENKDAFDFENAETLADGNHAMDYAFDKYLIIEDEQTGRLTKARPKQNQEK